MKVIIDLTEECNLRCKHCGNACEHLETVQNVEVDFVDILEQIPYKITRVDLLGGEPLLYRKFEKLMEYLLLNDIKASLITNGQFDEIRAEQLLNDSFKSISVSIDGQKQKMILLEGKEHMPEQRIF